MDQFLNGLNSLLAIKPKQGFVLLIGGLAIVTLNVFQVWPFNGIPDGWIILSAVVAVCGIAVLIVALGDHVTQRQASAKVAAKKRQDLSEAKQLKDQQALDNLSILSENEMRDLLWILRSGNRRFQGSIYEGALRSLTAKQICTRPMLSEDPSVFEVRDVVWAKRDEISAEHAKVRTPTSSPFMRW